MKLTKQQINALATTITNQIVKQGIDFKEKAEKLVRKQVKLTKTELKELQTLVKLSNKYITDGGSCEDLKEQVINARVHTEVETICKAAGVDTRRHYQVKADVEQFIHLATIDATDMETLIANLEQRLGIKTNKD